MFAINGARAPRVFDKGQFDRSPARAESSAGEMFGFADIFDQDQNTKSARVV
jgi:hypothetical protein